MVSKRNFSIPYVMDEISDDTWFEAVIVKSCMSMETLTLANIQGLLSGCYGSKSNRIVEMKERKILFHWHVCIVLELNPNYIFQKKYSSKTLGTNHFNNELLLR